MSENSVSPTGAPRLPPAIAQWVGLALVVALAALGALSTLYPEVRGIQVAFAVVTALAAALGIASPGLRKPLVALLMVGTLGLGGCAWWRARPTFQERLLECATKDLAADVAARVPEVVAALKGEPVDWQPALDALLLRAGAAGWCAIVALAQALESGEGGTTVDVGGLERRAEKAAFLRLYAGRALTW